MMDLQEFMIALHFVENACLRGDVFDQLSMIQCYWFAVNHGRNGVFL